MIDICGAAILDLYALPMRQLDGPSICGKPGLIFLTLTLL